MNKDPATLLGADGPFAQAAADFAPRRAQQDMASAVAGAIEAGESLVVEAGTGTGKTFAYLVPALLSGKRVIISTGTKALQDQLFHRDLPQVRKMLGSSLRVHLLKGRSNYLCLQRLEDIDNDVRMPLHDRRLLARVRDWSARTHSGDRAEVGGIPEKSPIWPRVTSTVENCLGSDCPHFEDCHVVKARRSAQEADVVVVNHHLLLADWVLKQDGFGEVLPGAQVFIIDEAHQLPELAGQFFSVSARSRQISDLADDALVECDGVSGALGMLGEQPQQLRRAVQNLRLALPDGARAAWHEVAAQVDGPLTALRLALDDLVTTLSLLAPRSRGFDALHARALVLRANLRQATALHGETMDDDTADAAETDAVPSPAETGVEESANDQTNAGTKSPPASVQWYETSEHGFALHATPIDLAPPLRDLWRRSGASWVFTSATLSVNGKFDHFTRQMGLHEPRQLLLDSPFDYARQTLLYQPPGLPDPRSRDYVDRLVDAVVPVLQASAGRAFMLFTSHSALQRCAALLGGRVDFPLFVQGSAPRLQLLDQFVASGNGVLLGAATFWEGVDVPGAALSCVIIDKLPFAPPDDPVLSARSEALRRAGHSPFNSLVLPSAVIGLKQGSGRLIRSIDDRGVLVLCDPRLVSSGYRHTFFRSLPPFPRSADIHDVRHFLQPSITPEDSAEQKINENAATQ